MAYKMKDSSNITTTTTTTATTTNMTPLTRREKLHVAVRIRPIDKFKMTGPKILKVLNKQTVILTELPLNYHNNNSNNTNNGVDLEHHHFTLQQQPVSISTSSSRLGHHHNNRLNNFTLHNGSSFHTHHDRPHQQHQHYRSTGTQGQGGGGGGLLLKHSQYHYDAVFDEGASQDEVYATIVSPLVPSVFDGLHVTVFAYGSTGSGKTYSMIGTPEAPGIMIHAVNDVFKMADKLRVADEIRVQVLISYLELYNEHIRDLLHPAPPGTHLELLDDKDQVHVSGLSEEQVHSTEEVIAWLHKGNRSRVVEPTSVNEASSRSHAILIVTVRQTKSAPATTGDSPSPPPPLLLNNSTFEILEGKLYLIDLAGSERASITKNSGVRLREGAHINRSLLALGNCITALASGRDGARYVNYRDSKLTRLLKTALGGPSRTAMIAHVNPISRQLEETRNTLIYAQRARSISNNIHSFTSNQIQPLNLDLAAAAAAAGNQSSNIIQDLQQQVQRLQLKLQEQSQQNQKLNFGAPSPTNNNINKYASRGGHRKSPVFGKYASGHCGEPMKSTIGNPAAEQQYSQYLIGSGAREYFSNLDRPNLTTLKEKIAGLFEHEFKLRNELLKIDGTMFQLAIDCEILRLIVLDWENLKLKKSDSDSEVSSSSDSLDWDNGKSEIYSVMSELKIVRTEQEKLLQKRASVEEQLKSIRGKILTQEEIAKSYLPDVQREILTLLCQLQQEQLAKMSAEIETELKSRGKLLLRFIRQKTLGEAIIYTQKHFFNAITGNGESTNYSPSGGGCNKEKLQEVGTEEDEMDSSSHRAPFSFPTLHQHKRMPGGSGAASSPVRWSSSVKPINNLDSSSRLFHTPSPSPSPPPPPPLVPFSAFRKNSNAVRVSVSGRHRQSDGDGGGGTSGDEQRYHEYHLPRLENIEYSTSTTKYSDFFKGTGS